MILVTEIQISDIQKYLNYNTTISAILSVGNNALICFKFCSFVLRKMVNIILDQKIKKRRFVDYEKFSKKLFYEEKQKIIFLIKYYRDKLEEFNEKCTHLKSKYEIRTLARQMAYECGKNEFDSANHFLVASFLIKTNVKLRPNKLFDKHWELSFPGGKPKPKETYIETLIREINEEVNLNLKEYKYQITNVYYVDIHDPFIKNRFENIILTISLIDFNLTNIIKNFKPNIEVSSLDIWNYSNPRDLIFSVFGS
jgi:hypothetical protein